MGKLPTDRNRCRSVTAVIERFFFGIFNHGCDSPSVYLLALGKGANSLICATKMREECLREFEKEMQT
jgi:hypothetical protein